jgi:sec-independent protein translocase protein TatA
MPNIGPLELAVVLIIVLVIFGPKRLPGLGRSLGSGMREFKDSITGKTKDDDEDTDERPALTQPEAAPAPPPEPAAVDPAREVARTPTAPVESEVPSERPS